MSPASHVAFCQIPLAIVSQFDDSFQVHNEHQRRVPYLEASLV